MNNAVIYARVSSTGDRQSTERQVFDLTDYATKNDLVVQQIYEEHIYPVQNGMWNVLY